MSEQEIAELLAEHEYALQLPRGAICTCGHVPTVDAGSLKTQQDYHRHHLADLLAARDRRVRAEALREAAGETRRMPADPDKAADWLRARADRTEATA